MSEFGSITGWVLADVQPATVKIALVSPSPAPRITEVRSYACSEFATFTEVVMRFEREQNIRLGDCEVAVSVSGATHGESFQIARGRWTLSRTGLAAVAGRPVHIVNDVAAAAWSLLGAAPPPLSPLGNFAAPQFEGPGRWSVMIADEGVGLAIVDIAETTRVLECEVGHAGFAPRDAGEDALLRVMRTRFPHVSWEQVLTLPLEDPTWKAAGLDLPSSEKAAMRARIMGSLVRDVALDTGSWSGVFLVGRLGSQLKEPALLQHFNERVNARQRFQRLVLAMPRWVAPQTDSILGGLATMMGRRLSKN